MKYLYVIKSGKGRTKNISSWNGGMRQILSDTLVNILDSSSLIDQIL